MGEIGDEVEDEFGVVAEEKYFGFGEFLEENVSKLRERGVKWERMIVKMIEKCIKNIQKKDQNF